MLKVEIVYAKLHIQRIVAIEVVEGCTIEAAILYSGIMTIFPEIDLTKQKVGVFSKPRELTDLVNDGDRIEIYRPLTIDPKEARRAKAKNLAKNGTGAKS